LIKVYRRDRVKNRAVKAFFVFFCLISAPFKKRLSKLFVVLCLRARSNAIEYRIMIDRLASIFLTISAVVTLVSLAVTWAGEVL
jgi:hypothetical protein